jgi:hypothetical protein
MPVLSNPKHETFCHGVADGLRQIDAYERAGYPRSASAASQLFNKAEIQGRMQELISEKQDIAAANGDTIDNLPSELNREWLIKTLMQNVLLAQKASQISPANKAVEMLAELIGYSFKKPVAAQTSDDGDPKKPADLDMDKMAAGLAAIGRIMPPKDVPVEDEDASE